MFLYSYLTCNAIINALIFYSEESSVTYTALPPEIDSLSSQEIPASSMWLFIIGFYLI